MIIILRGVVDRMNLKFINISIISWALMKDNSWILVPNKKEVVLPRTVHGIIYTLFPHEFLSISHTIASFTLVQIVDCTHIYVCNLNPHPRGPSLRSDDCVGRPFCCCVVFSFSFPYYFSSLPLPASHGFSAIFHPIPFKLGRYIDINL